MRIITGSLRGRRIQPPANLEVRPTTDMAKEGLFNILAHRIELDQVRVLDLFAGTGNISFEFVSRGVMSVTSVDQNTRATTFIHETVSQLQIENMYVVKADAFRFLESTKQSYDLIFADPPYDMKGVEKLPSLIFDSKVLSEKGIFILEHAKSLHFENDSLLRDQRSYGKVHFSFFSRYEMPSA